MVSGFQSPVSSLRFPEKFYRISSLGCQNAHCPLPTAHCLLLLRPAGAVLGQVAQEFIDQAGGGEFADPVAGQGG